MENQTEVKCTEVNKNTQRAPSGVNAHDMMLDIDKNLTFEGRCETPL